MSGHAESLRPRCRAAARSFGAALVALLALVSLVSTPARSYPRFVHAPRADLQGLGGAIASALSPDGRYLYVAAFTDHAVSIFARDPLTGALTFVGSLADTAGPASARIGAKGGLVDGLSGVADLAISPDGEYLYTASWEDDAIGIFRRGAGGGLFFEGTITDPVLRRLDAVSALALSPDGGRLFATAYNSASLCVFDRQASDGSLSLSQCVVDPTLLDGARGLALTADGARAYVAAMESDALAWWDLGSTTGPQAVRDGDPGVSGLDGAYAVALSQDGEDVYVASFHGERLVHLRRSPPGLSFVEEHALGLGAKVDVWVHPSDAVIFVTSIDGAVYRLFRNAGDGRLTPSTYFPTTAAGIESPVGLTGSASGEHLYVAALSGSVVEFRLTYAIGEWYPVQVQTIGSEATPLLEGLSEVVVDPAGRALYAAGEGSILKLRREPSLGTVWLFNWLSVPGLSRSALVVLDGGHVYVGSEQSGTVVRRRSNLTLEGELTTSLSGISDLAAAPNGQHLYAVSDADEALVVLYPAGPAALAEIDRLDGSTHPTIFDGTSWVGVSPDGSHVYTASYGRGAVTSWERDADTGLLTLRSSVAVSGSGSSQRASAAVSPDGRHVYAVGLTGDDLRVYERQPDGALLPSLHYQNGIGGFEGLSGAEDVIVSADGSRVYVAGTGDDEVAVLARDPADGSLSPRPGLHNVAPIRGLQRPRALAVSPDGSNLYVAAAGPALGIGGPYGAAVVFDTSAFFGDGFESGDASAWSAAMP